MPVLDKQVMSAMKGHCLYLKLLETKEVENKLGGVINKPKMKKKANFGTNVFRLSPNSYKDVLKGKNHQPMSSREYIPTKFHSK